MLKILYRVAAVLIMAIVLIIVAGKFGLLRSKGKVEASLIENDPGCASEGAQFAVFLKNGSRTTVNSTRYEISVYRKGYSDGIAYPKEGRTDKILEPGDTFKICDDGPEMKSAFAAMLAPATPSPYPGNELVYSVTVNESDR